MSELPKINTSMFKRRNNFASEEDMQPINKVSNLKTTSSTDKNQKLDPPPLFSLESTPDLSLTKPAYYQNTSSSLPAYKTHGLGQKGFQRSLYQTNNSHRKNRANRNYNHSYKGGMSNEDKEQLKLQNQHNQAQQNFPAYGHQNKRQNNKKNKGGVPKGHQCVVFHPRNLIKDSFFEDPWAGMEAKPATAEEIRRSTDTRSSGRLFNAKEVKE